MSTYFNLAIAQKPLWVYPLVATGKREDIARLVKFSMEDTQKIYRAAKAHGRKVTQVLSALIVLAYAESVLNTAGKEGEERFQEVSSSYETATHHNIVLNPWDQVRLTSSYGYTELPNIDKNPHSALNFREDMIPLDHPTVPLSSCCPALVVHYLCL